MPCSSSNITVAEKGTHKMIYEFYVFLRNNPNFTLFNFRLFYVRQNVITFFSLFEPCANIRFLTNFLNKWENWEREKVIIGTTQKFEI